MLRNVSEIKGIVFHISDSPFPSSDDWEFIQNIYDAGYNCLFLTDLDELPGFINAGDIIKVEPLQMLLWPSTSLFNDIKEYYSVNTSEIVLVSKDSRFTKRSMQLLCGVILIAEKWTKYEQLSNAPDAIFYSYNQFFEEVVLANKVGRNYFGENEIPLLAGNFKSRYIHTIYSIPENKKIHLFSLGRYYSSKHYMHELHPYSKAIISNKKSESKLSGQFNNKLADLIIKTIESFPNSFKLDALCYVPPRPDEEESRFEAVFSEIFSDDYVKKSHIEDISHFLISIRNFQKQKFLNQEERLRNVEGAFTVTESLEGKNVMIIDDVITTGATLKSCADALFLAGAESVSFFVFAINQLEQPGLFSEYRPICPHCSENLYLYINSTKKRPFYSCPVCRRTFDFDLIIEDLNRRIK
ncbi:ComF family protein [Streptococcus periodonticum]|nr:phosphoribosyltransferase family protein [Streptococcus periodonticum]